MTHLDSILKSRDITVSTKVRIVKVMVFLVVIYRCEGGTIRKAERQRIDAFKLWSWRRVLRVPWTARRSNQSILKEINPEYALEGLMLKFKLQYLAAWCEGPTHWKRPMLGKIEGKKRCRQPHDEMVRQHHWLKGHKFEQTPGDSRGQRSLVYYCPWGHKPLKEDLVTEQ